MKNQENILGFGEIFWALWVTLVLNFNTQINTTDQKEVNSVKRSLKKC
jgi:hypothetical protein